MVDRIPEQRLLPPPARRDVAQDDAPSLTVTDVVENAPAPAPLRLLPPPRPLASHAVAAPVAALDPNDPQAGIRCGSYLRPDPIFSDPTQMVVHTDRTPANPNGIQSVSYHGHHLVAIEHLFTGSNEILIGFGAPTVFTVVPRGNDAQGHPQTGYEKLDAFTFFRRPAEVASAELIPTGVYLRPRNLPADAADALRAAMHQTAGHRFESSASTVVAALKSAGFTSKGFEYSGKFLPLHLFLGIKDHGLEYKGQPVNFDVVSTTPDTLDQHFRGVVREELGSVIDAIKHPVPEDPTPAPGTVPLPPAPGPNNPQPAAGPLLHLRNSRPGAFGSMARWVVGAHVMWEVLPQPTQVDINQFLPETLVDKFDADRHLGTSDYIKSKLFDPPKEKFVKGLLAEAFDDAGNFTPEQLASMFRIPGPGEEIPPDDQGRIAYNIVICGDKTRNRVAIARLDVKGGDKLDDVLSKHVLIAGYDKDVRFAGEIWAERYTRTDGTSAIRIHINNNSGTYRPSAVQADAAAAYLREVFQGVEIVAHPMTPPPPHGHLDYLKSYPVADPSTLKGLEGKTVTLHDGEGNSQEYKIHHFKTVAYDMNFMDTPQRDLLRVGGVLRERTQFKKPDGDDVKKVDIEAKVAEGSVNGYQMRVTGESYENQQDMATSSPSLWSSNSHDKAVSMARHAIGADRGTVDGATAWAPVVSKSSTRDVYFVTPTTLLGRAMPRFIVSVDANASRPPGTDRPQPGSAPTYTVMQPQIFTKLPWTKKITPARIAEFEDLCRQLSRDFGVQEATQTPYAEALSHLTP